MSNNKEYKVLDNGEEIETTEEGNGIMHGTYRTYDENNVKVAEHSYNKGKSFGPTYYWFSNGNMKLCAEYDDNGEFHGDFKVWYENGNLCSHYNYKHGKLDGVYKSWYINGNIQTIKEYNNGTHDGKSEHYYENGQLSSKYKFKNGNYEGIRQEWYENGQKKSECIKGIFSYQWNEDGKLIAKNLYNHDKSMSFCHWHDNGNKSFSMEIGPGGNIKDEDNVTITWWNEQGEEVEYLDKSHKTIYKLIFHIEWSTKILKPSVTLCI